MKPSSDIYCSKCGGALEVMNRVGGFVFTRHHTCRQPAGIQVKTRFGPEVSFEPPICSEQLRPFPFR